jgi:hypothetical protein
MDLIGLSMMPEKKRDMIMASMILDTGHRRAGDVVRVKYYSCASRFKTILYASAETEVSASHYEFYMGANDGTDGLV